MSDDKRISLKGKLYNFLSKNGIKLFTVVFPEFFAKEPLNPTERYVEYPFAVSNLPKPPCSILDIGCAGSYFPLLLSSFGYNVYAIDIRPYKIINKLKFANFQFYKTDIRENTFKDNYFDAITAISTIEHIGIGGRYGMDDDLEADKKAIGQMHRILKQKGVLLLTIPFGKPKIMRPYMRVYDMARIQYLASNFTIEGNEYYMQDKKSDDWVRCSQQEAMLFDISPDKYPLCLLKLRKKI